MPFAQGPHSGGLALPGRAHEQEELVNARPPPVQERHLLLHLAQWKESLVERIRIRHPRRDVGGLAARPHQRRAGERGIAPSRVRRVQQPVRRRGLQLHVR